MSNRKQSQVNLKRAYEAPAKADGCRLLVDRVWPRGITKQELQLDEWLKDVAPSTQLRKWFGHDPAKWGTFKDRFFRELDGRPEAVERLLARTHAGTVTLVFGAKDTRHSNAVALKEYLEGRTKKRARAKVGRRIARAS